MKSSSISNPACTPFERKLECKKLLLRRILEQTRRNGDDLAVIKSRLDRHDQRFDDLERTFDGLDGRFDSLERQLRALRNDLPRIIGDAVRDALREHDQNRCPS